MGEPASKRKKYQRRKRKASSSTDAEENLLGSSLGNFNSLPTEMIFETFNWLQIHELGDVALTCMSMRNYVCSYIQTRPGIQKICLASKFENYDHDNDNPPEIAIFFKKLVMFWPCRTKINFIANIMLQSYCLWNEECAEQNYFLGIIIQFVMVNWTEPEKKVAHDILENKSGKRKMLEEVLASPKGLMTEKEKTVRHYYQGVYLNSVTKELGANWFYLILQKQPYFYQAKIFLLLFSPINAGQIQWEAFTEVMGNTPDRQEVIDKAIYNIASVLYSLKRAGIISSRSVSTVGDEILDFPVLWCPQNFCQFMLCTGNDTLQLFLKEFLYDAKYAAFANFLMLCSNRPICLSRPTAFSDFIIQIIKSHDESKDRSLFLPYFYNYFKEYRNFNSKGLATRQFFVKITDHFKADDQITILTWVAPHGRDGCRVSVSTHKRPTVSRLTKLLAPQMSRGPVCVSTLGDILAVVFRMKQCSVMDSLPLTYHFNNCLENIVLARNTHCTEWPDYAVQVAN